MLIKKEEKPVDVFNRYDANWKAKSQGFYQPRGR